jgi:hypothetical protein
MLERQRNGAGEDASSPDQRTVGKSLFNSGPRLPYLRPRGTLKDRTLIAAAVGPARSKKASGRRGFNFFAAGPVFIQCRTPVEAACKAGVFLELEELDRELFGDA